MKRKWLVAAGCIGIGLIPLPGMALLGYWLYLRATADENRVSQYERDGVTLKIHKGGKQ